MRAPVALNNWFRKRCLCLCVRSWFFPIVRAPTVLQVCLCCGRMFLQDEQQVATVPSDNNRVPFVDTGLQEGVGENAANLHLRVKFKVCLYVLPALT